MNIFINVFLMPILCFLCIVAYALIIFVITKENKKKEKFYEYLTMMCTFNMILCFIQPFQLISFCIFPNSIYCSSLYKSIYSQYIYIIFTKLIGNTIKTCAYWSNVSFTLSRYIMVSSYKGKKLNKIDKLPTKYYLLILIVSSFLLNLSSFFEYSAHEYNVYQNFIDRDFYQYPFYSSSDYFKPNSVLANRNKNVEYILNVLHAMKILFAEILFLVFLFVFDIVLYIFLKQSEAKKQNLVKTKETDHLTFKQKKILIAKQRHSRLSMNKVKVNILLNSINFFLFKLPFIVFNLLFYVFSYDEFEFSFASNKLWFILCSYYKMCEAFSALSLLFLLFSFLFQFFVLIKLDKNFRIKNIKSHLKSLVKLKRN